MNEEWWKNFVDWAKVLFIQHPWKTSALVGISFLLGKLL